MAERPMLVGDGGGGDGSMERLATVLAGAFERQEAHTNACVDRIEGKLQEHSHKLEALQTDLRVSQVQLSAEVRAASDRAMAEERIIKHDVAGLATAVNNLTLTLMDPTTGVASRVKGLTDEASAHKGERRQWRSWGLGIVAVSIGGMLAWVANTFVQIYRKVNP